MRENRTSLRWFDQFNTSFIPSVTFYVLLTIRIEVKIFSPSFSDKIEIYISVKWVWITSYSLFLHWIQTRVQDYFKEFVAFVETSKKIQTAACDIQLNLRVYFFLFTGVYIFGTEKF